MKTKRQNDIMKLLAAKRSLRTDWLVQHFGVSIETIRRDIHELENLGMVKKVYGGIQLASDDLLVSDLQSWNNRMDNCLAEKQSIAQQTLELIPDRSTIVLDIGTTTYALSRLLSARQDLTVITCSLRIASELSRNTDHCIYVIGGRLQKGEQVTMGSFARSFLDNFASIDLFLCGADGISLDTGITEFSEAIADIKKYLVSLSARTILLADHSKFGKKSLFRCCSVADVDTLVTDGQVPPRYLDAFEKAGVETITAENGSPNC